MALVSSSIDPASFTAIRLLSGAVLLALLVTASGKHPIKAGSWLSGGMLFLYAIAFALAYVSLTAGTGALILFGCVQATMIIASMIAKKHPSPTQWFGLLLAICGLVYLMLPGLVAPPMDRALMMAVAGVAWGIYSLRGTGGKDPVASTAGNFLRATPLAIVPLGILLSRVDASATGIGWAVLSGAVTSGLGYVFWYAALPSLGAIRAAALQLTVPVLSAIGGILFLGEVLSQRLLISAGLILFGVGLAVAAGRSK